MIKEKKFSRDRKKLALFDTKEEAEKREKQISFFKALEAPPSIGKKLKNKNLAK